VNKSVMSMTTDAFERQSMEPQYKHIVAQRALLPSAAYSAVWSSGHGDVNYMWRKTAVSKTNSSEQICI
jgi:hypothetical protein